MQARHQTVAVSVVAILALTGASAAEGCMQGFSAHTSKAGTYYAAPGLNRLFDDESTAQTPLMKGSYKSFTCYVYPLPKSPIIISLASGPCGKPIDFSKGLRLTMKDEVTGSVERPHAVTAAYENTCLAVRFEIKEPGEQAVNCSTVWDPAVIKKGGEA